MRRPIAVVAARAAAVLLCVGISACGRGEPEPTRPNLVLIVVDTLRKDHLHSYGYARDTSPVIDALAAEGLQFDNAVAQSAWTLPSVASLFTSRLPAEVNDSAIDGKALSAVAADSESLAEILAHAGYQTSSLSANPYFVPAFGLTRGFEKKRFVHGGQADALVDQAIEWLDEADATERPFFLYLHFMDVHAPNNPPEPYASRYPTLDGQPHEIGHWTFAFTDGRKLDSREFEIYRSHKLALYDGCIRFVDDEIGRLVERLRRSPGFDSTAIWIASDHGEGLWERAGVERELGLDNQGRYGVEHGHSLVPELIEVPLIGFGAGIPRGRVSEQVRNLDVAPTLLALAGIETPASFRGADLIEPVRTGKLTERPAWSDTRTRARRVISWRDGGNQYLRVGESEHVFAASPEEFRDVSDERDSQLRELGRAVDSVLVEIVEPVAKAVRLDEALRDQLEALGYVR